jgi:hypothetical protein
MRRLALLSALLGAACIPNPGPTMSPGQDCLECHGGGGGEEDAVAWTVAGTWSGEGHHVSITDSAGKSFTLTTNQVGNFYTREPLQQPLHLSVSVDGRAMPGTVSYGGCNRCHGSGGDGGGGG